MRIKITRAFGLIPEPFRFQPGSHLIGVWLLLCWGCQLAWGWHYWDEKLLLHPYTRHLPNHFDAYHNPAALTKSEGVELSVETYPDKFQLYHAHVPLLYKIRLGWTLISTYNHSINAFSIARPFHTPTIIRSISPGIGLKYDNVSGNILIDAGLSADIALPKGGCRIGMYSLGLMGDNNPDAWPTEFWYKNNLPFEPDYFVDEDFRDFLRRSGRWLGVARHLFLRLDWTLPGEWAALHSEFLLEGKKEEREGVLRYLYRTKYLGLTIKPARWVTFGYKIDQHGLGEFETHCHWKGEGMVRQYAIKFRGYRYNKEHYMFGTALSLSFFGQKGPIYKRYFQNTDLTTPEKKRARANSYNTDSSDTRSDLTLTESRQNYSQEKISFLRGTLFPYVNTFGIVTTFAIPAGVSNIVVGNRKAGYFLLGGAAVCGGFAYFSLDHSRYSHAFPEISIAALAGSLCLKLADFFIARNYVKQKNSFVKKKVKFALSPSRESLKLTGGVSF